MKKLMIALAAAATTVFAFGAGTAEGANRDKLVNYFHGWTGTSFEDLTEGPVSVGEIVGKDDTGNQDGENKFWYSAATETDELGAITNEVAGSGVSRPDAFSTQGNTKSLQIDTTSPLFRTALPNSSGVQPVDIGDGIYLDTLVKFTAADEAFAENLTGGDKIAIEYVEHEAEGDDVGYTNFVVRAGLIGAELGQTNYFAAVPAGFNKDAWHRLTVRTIADVGDGNVGFVIYLDGDMAKTLEYSKDVDAGFGTLNALAQTFYNNEKHALFPSAVAAEDIGGSTISAVAFSGSGFIDDVSFTATKPTFINEAILVTIAWDEHVTGMKINGTTLTAEQVAAKSWTGEPNEGSVVAIPTFDTGYVAGAPELPEGATYNSETKTFGNLTAGMTCTIKSMFPLYEVNGVAFDDLEDALTAAAEGTAQNPATLKLLANCGEGISLGSGTFVIIDLAGHDIQGTAEDSFSITCKLGANVVVTNSIPATGAVKVSLMEDASVAMSVKDEGTVVSVYDTKFEGYVSAKQGGVLKIYSGIFYDDEVEGVEGFAANYNLQNSPTVTALGGGYYQVGGGDTPQPTTFALTTTGGANAEITTNPADVSALTEATDVTITASATNGFTYATVDLSGTDWLYNSNDDAISMTTNISENTTVVVPDAVSEQSSEDWPEGQDLIDAEGKAAGDLFSGITNALATADAKAVATWAEANNVAYADKGSILPEAFLLNCANTQAAIDEAAANFKITAITVSGDTVTIAPADGADYGNGKVVIEGTATLSPISWHAKTDGDHFFRATLVVKPVAVP